MLMTKEAEKITESVCDNRDSRQYIQIARKLDVFHDKDIAILQSVLEDYENARDGYLIIDDKQDNLVRGFVVFGRIPLTAHGWDIYWMAVDKDHQGKGIGQKLLKSVEAHILKNEHVANLRVETSTRKEYAHARNLYSKAGFQEVGRITDFYDEGDDIVIFCKHIAASR